MRFRTRQNTITVPFPATAVEILGPNPYRKAIVLSPLAPSPFATPGLITVQFNAGLAQSWIVPAGVNSIVNAYVWGSGGNPGAAGAALGGGGGGGGGFAGTGAKPVV